MNIRGSDEIISRGSYNISVDASPQGAPALLSSDPDSSYILEMQALKQAACFRSLLRSSSA